MRPISHETNFGFALNQTDLDLAASTATPVSEVARRYAGALLDLASTHGDLDRVAGDLKTLGGLIHDSPDLRRLLASPAFARDDKVKALVAVAERAGVGKTATGFLGTLAQNGRASELPATIAAFEAMYAAARGIKRAVVITASAMTPDQRARLEASLAKAMGGNIELEAQVNPALVGGIQLRIGSQLIDASIASKLDRMNTAMKGA